MNGADANAEDEALFATARDVTPEDQQLFSTKRETCETAEAPAQVNARAPQLVLPEPNAQASEDYGTLPRIFDKIEQLEFVFAEARESTQDVQFQLSELTKRLEKVECQIARAAEEGSPSSAQADQLVDRLATLETGFATLADAQKKAADAAEARVKSLQEFLDARLLAVVENQVSGLGAVEQAKIALDEKLSGIALSLSEGASTPDLRHIEAQIAEIIESSSSYDRPGNLAKIEECLQKIMAPLQAEISQSVALVLEKPDPVIDLAPQKQMIARFGTVMAQVVRRLEAVASALDTGSLPPLLEALQCDSAARHSAQIEKMDDLCQEIAQLRDASEDHHPQDGEIDQQAFERLIAQIDALAERPNPTLDLTAQQKGFAQFNAAAGQVLRRFEGGVENLISRYEALDERLATHLAEPDAAHLAQDATAEHLAEAVRHLSSTCEALSARDDVGTARVQAALHETKTILAEFMARVLQSSVSMPQDQDRPVFQRHKVQNDDV